MKQLSADLEAAVIAAARDSARVSVSGLTHTFYKYPARFSPLFVRAAIEAFTAAGDLVVDNHVGGGTTLVEALALGRHAIGVDISTLAHFVTKTKTTTLGATQLNRLSVWANSLDTAVNAHMPSIKIREHAALGYYKHLDHRDRWRLRKAIEQGIASAESLRSDALIAFARCVILRTAQWALDGRKVLPSLDDFRAKLKSNALKMIEGARALALAASAHPERPKITVINRSSIGIEHSKKFAKHSSPKLILTSPPYPGVHVLYHRWQVDGRKEAPLPFMIANKMDGAAGSFYTMGDRKAPELNAYFKGVKATMSSAAKLANGETVIVQMLAFSQPDWQLPRYLIAMEEAGLVEAFLPSLCNVGDGRLWRSVPSRRWYSEQRGYTPGSREVVLFHRKRHSGDTIAMRPLAASSAKLSTSEL